MFDRSQSRQFEEWIRARSYAIWESGGRADGRAEECWLQAQKEVEALWQAAIDGETTDVVPPQAAISMRPIRRTSVECHFHSDRLAA